MTGFTESNHPQPDLFASATGVSQPDSWFSTRSGTPRLLSVAVHVMLLAVALIPWTSRLPRPKLLETAIVLYRPSDVLLKPQLLPARQQGGGGGGKRQPTPASLGVLPRGADKQLAPPDPEPPKNPDPALIVEPTIVAPQLVLRPLNLLNIGDPNGVVGPPSSGPGIGGGIGNGDGHGDGRGKGPGAIDGSGGGCCDGTYQVGGAVKAPIVIRRIEPEYSEEARKARYQGTVLLQALIRRDGTVDILHVVRSLGFGLDQNAIEALKQWRFRPATMNGKAVDVTMNVEVSFNIR